MTRPLVVVGDALLDVDLVGSVTRLAPDAPVPVVEEPERRPRPGGAALAALLAARDGRRVVLVAGFATDPAGRELRELLTAAGVDVVALPLAGTTSEKVRVRADGRSLLRLDRGAGVAAAEPADPRAAAAIAGAGAVLVSDYGRGVAALPGVRAALAALPPGVPVVWDPHPRGAQPVPGVRLATPNDSESRHFLPAVPGDTIAAVARRASALRSAWSAAAVAVTLGRRGALLVDGDGTPRVAPAPEVPCFDPCGAGDRFASAAVGLLADGALVSEAVIGAVTAASAFVAAGGAAAMAASGPPAREVHRAADVVAAVRARGGVVVATGGCFDLLHAGHVSVLRAARALGDCLVVCLNSDDSVRRLKGPGRPLVPALDRAAVLAALECVDAVEVFEEDTPEALLCRLRPDVWAKGGDYTAAALPEAPLVESWGGQAVVLPYLAGRSTTRLVRAAGERTPGRDA